MFRNTIQYRQKCLIYTCLKKQGRNLNENNENVWGLSGADENNKRSVFQISPNFSFKIG